MFVLNPDQYSLPCYRIGPFQTRDLAINHNLPESNRIDTYLSDRFVNKEFIYTENGREAIHLALSYYKLKKDDVVTILTTSGNFYISGCVTLEIEKFCKWSRNFLPETKLIFLNHEFGFPYKDLKKLKEYNLPIIEDCASSFFSQNSTNEVGEVGDFVIYSFPKMFPLQIGGLLVSNIPNIPVINHLPGLERLQHIKNVLSNYIDKKDEIINARLSNYRFLKTKFESLELPERFSIENGIVPGVFMFRTDNYPFDLPELKKFFYAHGVQSSIFYGEEAFFIPVHQSLTGEDMEYFYQIINSYIGSFGSRKT